MNLTASFTRPGQHDRRSGRHKLPRVGCVLALQEFGPRAAGRL